MDKYYLKYGERLKNDKELILSVSKNYDKALAYADPEILSDEVFILNAVSINGSSLYYSNTSHRDNEKIVLTAVKQKWKALKYASDRLKNNETIVLEAINGNGNAIRYASDNLKNNRNLVLAAVKNKAALDYIPYKFLNEDTEIISELVNRKFESKYSLEFASEEIKNNRELVLKIVQNNGLNLAFVGHEFKKDMEIVNAAAFQNFMSLSYSTLTFEELRPMILQNLKSNDFTQKNKSKLKNIELNLNIFSVLAYTRIYLIRFRFVNKSYTNNKELMLLAIEVDPISYNFISDELKLDRDIVLKFIEKYEFIERYNLNYNFENPYIRQIHNYFKNDLEVLDKLSNATNLDIKILQNYEEYINATTLIGKWLHKLDEVVLNKLKRCKTLFYPGAGYDFSTLQFFMENSNVKKFYFVNYSFENFDSILPDLKNQLFPFDYKILDIINLNPKDFNENNYDNFYHPDYIKNHESSGPNFITKIIIVKEDQQWNLFYFGTEGIATYEILLKNRIKLDIIVAIDHGSWSPFCGKSLLEVLATRYSTIPSLILSDNSLQWDNFIPCSELFGKFGFTEEKRMLYYYKK